MKPLPFAHHTTTDPSYLYKAEVRDVIDADTYCDQSQSIRP